MFNLSLEVPALDCYEVLLGGHRLGSYGFNDLKRRDFMVGSFRARGVLDAPHPQGVSRGSWSPRDARCEHE